MPLDHTTLKASLIAAFNARVSSTSTDSATEIDHLCTDIANAMVAFVSSATVTYSAGLTCPSGAVVGVSGMTLS